MRIKCPNCGSATTYYHEYGTGITRVVCAKKCQGWKVIEVINRFTTSPSNEYAVALKKLATNAGLFFEDHEFDLLMSLIERLNSHS